jgi:hypothetical protein
VSTRRRKLSRRVSRGEFVDCDCPKKIEDGTRDCYCRSRFYVETGKVIPDQPMCGSCSMGRHT